MIQIYVPTNTSFDRNGDTVLTPTSASVHAVLNGAWEATIEHPIDSEGRWKSIEEGAVLSVPSFNGRQLFRIKQKTKQDSGITATAEPIFMDAMDDCFLVDVRPTGKNGQEALDIMTAPNAKYTGVSDIMATSTAYYQYANLIEALNGDTDNSFVSRWGGEIVYDNYKVIVNQRAGADNGVELRYGKNLSQDGLTEDVDIRDVITRIYPKAYNGYCMSNNGYVDSELINNYPTIKIGTMTFDDVKMSLDASENDAENGVIICNTQEELDDALRKKCEEQYEGGLDKPKVTISADMIMLQGTDDYAEYQNLESVSLGDTIHCRNMRLGIISDARVIELTYDCMRKKVNSVVLGDFKQNYFDGVSSAVNRIDSVTRPDGSLVADKIAGYINGAMASLRAQYNVADKQDVLAILFENLDETSEMFGALAIGTQGIMISKERNADNSGWVWTLAITYAGIVANAIVTGQIMSQDGSMIIDLNDANINMDLNDGSKVIIGKEGFYNMFGGSKNEYFHLLHAERVSLGWDDFKEGMATHLYTLPEEFAGKDVTIFGVINEFIAGANKAMTHLSTDYVYSEETRRVRAWVNANTVDSSFNTIDPAPPASVIITFIAIA